MKLKKNGLIQFSKAESDIMEAHQIMGGVCGNISIGATYNCTDPIVAGTNTRLLLIDKDVFDLATISFDVTQTTLITDIVLTGIGNAAYAFEGIRRSNRPQTAFVPAAVSVGFDHQVEFQIFNIIQAQKENIEKMALSKMVAIIQNTNAVGNGDSVFEVFGMNVGMEVQAGAMRINTDQETNGSYTINLKTSDDAGKEPKLPQGFWDTDFATTKPKVDALLVPVS